MPTRENRINHIGMRGGGGGGGQGRAWPPLRKITRLMTAPEQNLLAFVPKQKRAQTPYVHGYEHHQSLKLVTEQRSHRKM